MCVSVYRISALMNMPIGRYRVTVHLQGKHSEPT